MNKFFVSLGVIVLLFSSAAFAKDKVNTISPVFYDKDQTSEYLTSGDYITNLGEFDLKSRLKRDSFSVTDVVSFFKNQSCAWSSSSKERVQNSIDNLNKTIVENGYKLPLPKEIPFMLTTMKEEGNAAAYTRKEGVVMSHMAPYSYRNLDMLVAHELFHVLTRNNPEFKAKMYKLLGFKMLKKEIEVPKSFKDMMISNPDVECHNSYVTLTIGNKKVDCAMYIYSPEKWTGGNFFGYMKVGLLEVDAKKCTLVLEDGNPIVHSLSEADHFFDKVGIGTDYVIDPEEILADNFSYVLLGRYNSNLCKEIRNLLLK